MLFISVHGPDDLDEIVLIGKSHYKKVAKMVCTNAANPIWIVFVTICATFFLYRMCLFCILLEVVHISSVFLMFFFFNNIFFAVYDTIA